MKQLCRQIYMKILSHRSWKMGNTGFLSLSGTCSLKWPKVRSRSDCKGTCFGGNTCLIWPRITTHVLDLFGAHCIFLYIYIYKVVVCLPWSNWSCVFLVCLSFLLYIHLSPSTWVELRCTNPKSSVIGSHKSSPLSFRSPLSSESSMGIFNWIGHLLDSILDDDQLQHCHSRSESPQPTKWHTTARWQLRYWKVACTIVQVSFLLATMCRILSWLVQGMASRISKSLADLWFSTPRAW